MKIRKAEASDKAAIIEMTKNTWDDGDYIKHVFDKWLAAPGEFTILEDQDMIVGCTKLTVIKPGCLWLEGIRVRPEMRRKGYAKVLADYQLNLAKTMGFDHLGLSTWYQNESVKMLVHYPFDCISKYKVLTYDLDLAGSHDITPVKDYQRVIDYFTPYLNGDYYACDWTFFTLDPTMIKTFFDRGEIYRHQDHLAIISDLYNKEKSLSIVYAHHVDQDLLDLSRALKIHKKKDYVMTMSKDQKIIDDLMDLGFEGYDQEVRDVYLYDYKDA